jgi:hypothetical protein
MAISVLSILACLASGYFKLGVEAVIASISGTYVLGRASQKIGIGVAAAKDPNSKVSDIINEIK